MPDAVQQDVKERLFKIDRAMQAAGFSKLAPEELRAAHQQLSTQAEQFRSQSIQTQAQQMQRSGQPAAQPPAGGAAMNPAQQPFQQMPFVSMQGGGTVRQPTFALVGERGPELALLQRGSVILPSQAAAQAVNQLGTPPPVPGGFPQLPPQAQGGLGGPGYGIGPQVSQAAQGGNFGPNGMSDFVRSLLLARLPQQALTRPVAPPVATPPPLPAVPTLPAQASAQAAEALARRRRARRFEGAV